MKNRKYFILLLTPFLFWSCKPTEKGYKAAYDAALSKREAVKADIDVNLPAGAFQQVDGPQLKQVDGVDVYVLHSRIKPYETVVEVNGPYCVAIGKYKMITNCRAQATSLCQEGYNAYPAKDTEDMFYTIAGSFKTLQEAVKFYSEYKARKNRSYVGLPDAPVIIYSPN